MIIECKFDSFGFRRAMVHPSMQVVADYLESDVQGDPIWCDELLVLMSEIESGKKEIEHATGNAHTLTITPKEAFIRCEFEDKSLRLLLDEFRQALLAWKAFIENEKRKKR